MRRLIYDPIAKEQMVIAVGVSGFGTNFERIYESDPAKSKRYVVFSNAPDCRAVARATELELDVVTLDSKEYAKGKRMPRKGAERDSYDKELFTMVERHAKPDLVCLAGYDLWIGDWAVQKYFPTMLNVHPGDTTKGFSGLLWVPCAKAILAGEDSVKSTLFFVNETDDGGPVLMQSASLPLSHWERELYEIRDFASAHDSRTMGKLRAAAEANGRGDIVTNLKTVAEQVQDRLKREGDWKIYPFAVHEMIAKGRVAIDNKGTVYVDGTAMPNEGYQVDRYGFAPKIERWV